MGLEKSGLRGGLGGFVAGVALIEVEAGLAVLMAGEALGAVKLVKAVCASFAVERACAGTGLASGVTFHALLVECVVVVVLT